MNARPNVDNYLLNVVLSRRLALTRSLPGVNPENRAGVRAENLGTRQICRVYIFIVYEVVSCFRGFARCSKCLPRWTFPGRYKGSLIPAA